MRIVSLNAWGGAMYGALAEWLPGCGADVLCLQEVTRTAELSGWTSFSDAERQLPQRANLFSDVGTLLVRHQGSFAASDAGPVVDGTGTSHRQDFGLGLFVDERLPVIGQVAEFVHRQFIDHDEWPSSDRPRLVQGVRVIDRPRQRTVAIVHLHGLRDSAGKQDTPDRRKQSERLARLVDRFRERGDLNVLPDNEVFGMLADIGLVDLVGTADTRTAQYRKPVRHASYMLVSDADAVSQFQAPAAPEVSDHRPLILDL